MLRWHSFSGKLRIRCLWPAFLGQVLFSWCTLLPVKSSCSHVPTGCAGLNTTGKSWQSWSSLLTLSSLVKPVPVLGANLLKPVNSIISLTSTDAAPNYIKSVLEFNLVYLHLLWPLRQFNSADLLHQIRLSPQALFHCFYWVLKVCSQPKCHCWVAARGVSLCCCSPRRSPPGPLLATTQGENPQMSLLHPAVPP